MIDNSSLKLPHRCATCRAQNACTLFSIPIDLLSRIQSIVEVRCYSRAFTVVRQGQLANGFYILRTGWMRLFGTDSRGKRSVIGIASPGTIVGLLAVVSGTCFDTSAETLEECELEYVPASEFSKILDENPRFALHLLKGVGKQGRRSREELFAFAGKVPSADRLLRVLEDMAEKCGQPSTDGVRLQIPVTVQDLADSIGCSRQWTTKLLMELEAGNVIQRQEGWIVLTAEKART